MVTAGWASTRRPGHDPDRQRPLADQADAAVGVGHEQRIEGRPEPPSAGAPRRDPELAPQEPRELVARREPARLALEPLDRRPRPRARSSSTNSGRAGNATRSSPWTGGQQTSATDDG